MSVKDYFWKKYLQADEHERERMMEEVVRAWLEELAPLYKERKDLAVKVAAGFLKLMIEDLLEVTKDVRC